MCGAVLGQVRVELWKRLRDVSEGEGDISNPGHVFMVQVAVTDGHQADTRKLQGVQCVSQVLLI